MRHFFIFGFSLITSFVDEAHSFVPTVLKKADSSSSSALFQQQQRKSSRRDIITNTIAGVGSCAALVFCPEIQPVYAADGDLTSQMFNEDGSLKEGVESEVKERYVQFSWDGSDQMLLNTDGSNAPNTKDGNSINLSYKLPNKWSDGKDGDEIYFDRTEGTNAKACKRITVFQAPGKGTLKQLEKASLVGVAKSLKAPEEELSRLYKADIISGKVKKSNDRTYYEFDMAAAPETCGSSDENLGLGFCPYDNIFLLSATVVDDRLYCIVVECDSTKIWKLASSELKRVRSSFMVENLSS